MKEALIIIDVQNDYFPGGSCELYRPLEAEKKIKELIDDSRASGRKIIYIQHINPPDDYFFIEGTDGVKISDRIKPAEEDKIIIKHYPNSFLETDLNEYLKSIGVEELIICGMMTHMCVDTTVRAAMDYGYSVKVVGDACATMDLAPLNMDIGKALAHQIDPADLLHVPEILRTDRVGKKFYDYNLPDPLKGEQIRRYHGGGNRLTNSGFPG